MTKLKEVAPFLAAKALTLVTAFFMLISLVVLLVINLFGWSGFSLGGLMLWGIYLVLIFIIVYLLAFCYNFLAERLGEIEIKLKQLKSVSERRVKMVEVKKIDVISLVRIYAAFQGVLSLVFAFFTLIAGIVQQEMTLIGLSLGMPIFCVLTAVIVGGLFGLIYNLVASQFGGIKIKFKFEDL